MSDSAGSSPGTRLESTGNAPPTPDSSDSIPNTETIGAETPLPNEDTNGEQPVKSQEADAVSAPNARRKKSRASRTYRGRTFRDIVQNHPRTEPERRGTVGYTVRELCGTMHIAADSLRAAYEDPGRLSLNSIAALAYKMGEDPLQLVADIFAETKAAEKESGKTDTAKRNRASKPKAIPTNQGDPATTEPAETTPDAE
jgi:hypothetical protein